MKNVFLVYKFAQLNVFLVNRGKGEGKHGQKISVASYT